MLDITGLLASERQAFLEVLRCLDGAAWQLPTECPSWTVKGIALHVLGDDLSLPDREAIRTPMQWSHLPNAGFSTAAPGQLVSPVVADGTFGYGKSVFEAAYAAAPDMTQNLAKAKQLIIDAGATGKSITIGMSSELTGISIEANALKAAAEAIGMKATLHSVSAQNFINFFIDPKARVGIDGFFTLNYGDYAGPESLLATLIPPDGSQNFDGYGVQGTDPQAANDSKAFTLFDEARSTADPNARAQKVADVEKMIATDLPWIPVLQPLIVLITSSNLTGAYASFAYMFAPWADKLGGTG